MNILLLTNNVSGEQAFLQQLNTLGHEVFCSKELLKKLELRKSYREFLPYFSAVIFSESVSNQSVKDVLKNTSLQNHQIFRRTDLVVSGECTEEEVKTRTSKISISVAHMSLDPSMEELREQLSGVIASKKNPKSDIVIQEFPYSYFSKKEQQVLKLLSESVGETVDRETIRENVWGNEKGSNSQLIQLSNIIKRIKYKFEEHDLHSWTIQTVWGQGYQLSKTE